MTSNNTLRIIRFSPYLKGQGPVFRLKTWDTGRRENGKWMIGYRLSYGTDIIARKDWTVLFEGEDFGCSPMHAIDSDQAIASLMVFLTMRPGDTDPEYFDDYTPAQLDYCSQHAETLACEVQDRFGND